MKYLRVLAIAIVAMFAFEGAQAQVIVKARIGAPVKNRRVIVARPAYHPQYQRTVVVTRPVVYHRPYSRAVVVTRPAYRRDVVIARPAYRRDVAYQRPYKRIMVRHY